MLPGEKRVSYNDYALDIIESVLIHSHAHKYKYKNSKQLWRLVQSYLNICHLYESQRTCTKTKQATYAQIFKRV